MQQRSMQEALEEGRARGMHVRLKLNRRLLSYLFAYVMCQLPGIPAALLHAFSEADDNAVYLNQEESNPLVAARVLMNSLQGLANSVVFAHHTGSLRSQSMHLSKHLSQSWCFKTFRRAASASEESCSAEADGRLRREAVI